MPVEIHETSGGTARSMRKEPLPKQRRGHDDITHLNKKNNDDTQ